VRLPASRAVPVARDRRWAAAGYGAAGGIAGAGAQVPAWVAWKRRRGPPSTAPVPTVPALTARRRARH